MRSWRSAPLAGLLMASCVWAGGASGALAAQRTGSLRVIPFPGTPDSSPSSQVIFSALAPSDLRSVTVVGSRSGRHRGRLQALPAAAGTSFVPAREFTPGETVHVTAVLSSPQAGTASGDPGANQLNYSFGVAVPVPAPATGLRPQAWMSGASFGPTQSFRSAPDLHPPILDVTRDPDHASGDIFAGVIDAAQYGPMILDGQGRLVWFLPGRSVANFAVQQYRGHHVLTWWQGGATPPRENVIMNRSYRTVATVQAGQGLSTDPHDFQLTSRGTAFLSATRVTSANLTSAGGPAHGTVIDDAIQEVDVGTGQVLWEWHTLGHIPLNASYAPAPQSSWPPYDYFHLNSIQQLPGGNLLVSSRDTWAVYEVSRKTGRVIWTLGGKYSNFKMGPGTNFEWQHDARLHGETLSVFDDAATPQEERQSSAKFMKVNIKARTVSLVRRYTHFPPLLAGSLGSVQTLPNGNVFVGWGASPEFSEFTPGGRQILNGTFPLGVRLYRIFRFAWTGQPHTRPSLAVSPSAGGHVTAYTSWNGATQVRSWRVLGGPGPHRLKTLGVTAARSGFETPIDVPSEPKYFAVQALSRQGTLLSASPSVADPAHLALFGSSVFVPASGGNAGIPVGCLTKQSCDVQVSVSAGGSVLGRGELKSLSSYRGGSVSVHLPALRHREAARVTVRSSSGLRVSRRMTLIPFSAAAGRRPAGPQTGDVVLASATDFVASSTGRASILTACYAAAPCHIHEVVSVAGHLAGTSRASVGANELAYVPLQLNQGARRALGRARGNRLTATVRITVGGRARTARVDLVSYG